MRYHYFFIFFHCRTIIPRYCSHHVHDRSLLPGHQGQRCRLPRADGDNPRCQFRVANPFLVIECRLSHCCSRRLFMLFMRTYADHSWEIEKGFGGSLWVMDDFHGQMQPPNISATVFPGLISCFTRSEGARLPPDLACAAGALSLWSKVSRNLSR